MSWHTIPKLYWSYWHSDIAIVPLVRKWYIPVYSMEVVWSFWNLHFKSNFLKIFTMQFLRNYGVTSPHQGVHLYIDEVFFLFTHGSKKELRAITRACPVPAHFKQQVGESTVSQQDIGGQTELEILWTKQPAGGGALWRFVPFDENSPQFLHISRRRSHCLS